MKTNRKKYFLDRDEYDTMMTIAKVVCPIWVITGKEPKEWDICPHANKDWYEWEDGKCDECIQKFLNEESEG